MEGLKYELAIHLILQKADGVILFDLVHVYAPQYNRLGVQCGRRAEKASNNNF